MSSVPFAVLCPGVAASAGRLAHVYHDGRLGSCAVALGECAVAELTSVFGRSAGSAEFAAGFMRQSALLGGLSSVEVLGVRAGLARA